MNVCHCGAMLEVESVDVVLNTAVLYHCYCPHCRARSAEDGVTVDVDGYGTTADEAVTNWQSRVDTF